MLELLRKIDKYIDFSFIRELTNDLYCHTNGRSATDPLVLLKCYLYNIFMASAPKGS